MQRDQTLADVVAWVVEVVEGLELVLEVPVLAPVVVRAVEVVGRMLVVVVVVVGGVLVVLVLVVVVGLG